MFMYVVEATFNKSSNDKENFLLTLDYTNLEDHNSVKGKYVLHTAHFYEVF